MGQKYRPAKDGIDEKSQGWQWSGQGAQHTCRRKRHPTDWPFFMLNGDELNFELADRQPLKLRAG
jgi:hypothetical protein